MSHTFFFYDLETSGVNPKTARIMQFAGQRTDADLNPIGEPYNFLVRLSDDVLPEPDAIMITGITPQMTIQEGLSEAEFFKIFCQEIVTASTVFVGFNNIRFDDEFIRYGLYRNFYDAYEWQWKNDCSKWDMLDVVRMTRALRPEGIKWPFAPDGKSSNRLELLTSLNNLDHANAHDALNDVMATIAVAKMIKDHQPKLFDFSFNLRSKKDVENFVSAGDPFIYVSGRYPAEYEKLAVVLPVGTNSKKGGSFVFDLRHDPDSYTGLSIEKLVELWRWNKDPEADRLPVKLLQYNRCPAIAPLSVLRKQDAQRLQINLDQAKQSAAKLRSAKGFSEKLVEAAKRMEKDYIQTTLTISPGDVDGALYNGFPEDEDKALLQKIRKEAPGSLASYKNLFHDERLKQLVDLYKARNFPKELTPDEQATWEKFKAEKLAKSLPSFLQRLSELSTKAGITKNQQYVLEELQLYAESIMPADV